MQTILRMSAILVALYLIDFEFYDARYVSALASVAQQIGASFWR
jgi:hypothetical protein